MKPLAQKCLTASLVLIIVFTGFKLSSQTISGRVIDALSLNPLSGANINLSPGDLGAVSDSSGSFEINDIAPGHYQLTVSFVGFEPITISDIWIRNGHLVSQEIGMKRQYSQLSEVIVRDHQNPLELGNLNINEEQVNRFAATYYDPARLITNSPDIAVTNDQNNRVSVRGISPNYNVWRLQGVEIVNPNHLTNAGTFSDEPIATGGSVNIISAQMLGSSNFRYGAFKSEFGNSLGGIFDMNLRKGNQRKRHHTVQASLIGLDLASEGPFSASSKATYAVNYRYSFTGLLTNLGVDFGGEFIGFQDLSFNLNFPLKNGSEFSVFALGGLNFNNFDAMSLEDSEISKDRSDIYLDGRMGGSGLSYRHKLGSGYAEHTVALSASENIREQNYYDTNQTVISGKLTEQVNQIVSWHSQIVTPLNGGSLSYGIMGNYYRFAGISMNKYAIEQYLLSPHVNFNYQLFKRLVTDIGINYLVDNNGDQAVDPRVGFTYYLNNDVDLYLRGGLYSQLLNPFNYYFVYGSNGGDFLAVDRRYYLQQSRKLSLGLVKTWSNWDVNLEGFYNEIPEMRVWDGKKELVSTAQSSGISFVANRNYSLGWYLNGGGSVFNSIWGEGETMDNRYNTNYNLNVNAGREWSKNKETKIRVFSINGRVMYQGGLKDPFYTNEDLTQPLPQTTVVTNNADFFRVDFRAQWTWNKSGKSTSLSIDIQNITNNQNEAYTYFDSFSGQVQTQYQLGLIPILTYRFEF